jgi:vacuolar-type H+-ATPase catalytic subunit A/Vma1
MAKYLNSKEKARTLTLAAFKTLLDEIVADWEGAKRPTSQVKLVKTTRTYVQKTLAEMLKGLDDDEIAKLLAELNKMQVITKYTKEAVKESEAMKKLDSVTAVKTSDLLELIKLGLASCSVCEEKGSECHYKKILIGLDIEPINLNPEDNGCPYRL